MRTAVKIGAISLGVWLASFALMIVSLGTGLGRAAGAPPSALERAADAALAVLLAPAVPLHLYTSDFEWVLVGSSVLWGAALHAAGRAAGRALGRRSSGSARRP